MRNTAAASAIALIGSEPITSVKCGQLVVVLSCEEVKFQRPVYVAGVSTAKLACAWALHSQQRTGDFGYTLTCQIQSTHVQELGKCRKW